MHLPINWQYLAFAAVVSAFVLVKAAILGEPGLKSSEINVETFKGVVQLSAFVSSREDISTATKVTRAVNGVTSVKNDMHLKQ
jgi:osmotically-inducible protein OsmY